MLTTTSTSRLFSLKFYDWFDTVGCKLQTENKSLNINIQAPDYMGWCTFKFSKLLQKHISFLKYILKQMCFFWTCLLVFVSVSGKCLPTANGEGETVSVWKTVYCETDASQPVINHRCCEKCLFNFTMISSANHHLRNKTFLKQACLHHTICVLGWSNLTGLCVFDVLVKQQWHKRQNTEW